MMKHLKEPFRMKKEEIVVEVNNQDHHHPHNQDQDHHHPPNKKEEEEEEHVKKRGFRPLAFLLGFPFAICGLLLSLAGGLVWILGALLTYVCPCLKCCADLSNTAMDYIKLPLTIFTWFIDRIPC